MKTSLAIIKMLTVFPIMAATTIITYNPEMIGDAPIIPSILTIAVFGVITVPAWITYIPAIISTPIIMNRLSKKSNFYSVPFGKFIAILILSGVAVGVFILLPFILPTINSAEYFWGWVWVGTFSGAITFSIISSIYRMSGRKIVINSNKEIEEKTT